MLVKRFLLLIIMVASWVMVFPAAAQSSQQTFTSQDGLVTFSYPNGWFATEDRSSITLQNNQDGVIDGTGKIRSGQGGFTLFVFSQNDHTSTINRMLSGANAVEKLQSFVNTHPVLFDNIGSVDATTVGEHPAAQAVGTYVNTKNEVEVLLVDFENGGYGFILISTAPNELDRMEPKLRSIAATIQYTPPASAQPSPVHVSSLVPIDVLNAASLKQLSVIDAHIGAASAVAISPDSQTIVSGGDDGAILFWDTATGQQKLSPPTQSARIQQLLFTPDGQQVVSAGDDGTVRLWDAATAEQQDMQQQDGAIWYMAIRPDGKELAYVSYVRTQTRVVSSTVWLWNLETGSNEKVTDLPDGFFANSMAFSPDGKQLLYSASGNTQFGVWLVDDATKSEISNWSQSGDPIDVFFTADSTPMVSLTTGTGSADVLIWNPRSDATPMTLSGHFNTVYQTVLNPSRTILGTPSFDGTTRLWDLDNGDMLIALPHNNSVWGIAFSADGRLLVTSDANGSLYIWGINANI